MKPGIDRGHPRHPDLAGRNSLCSCSEIIVAKSYAFQQEGWVAESLDYPGFFALRKFARAVEAWLIQLWLEIIWKL